MSISEKIYRLLLRAYSGRYRSRYAEPMEQLFRDSRREVRGFPGLIALWGRTLADWVVSVPASYRAVDTSLFSLYGDPARRCVFFARCEASSFSDSEVSVNHLLLGILRQQPAIVPRTALELMVHAIEANEPHERYVPLVRNPHTLRLKVPNLVGPGEIELDEESARAVKAAIGIAHAAGRPRVTPTDLATAIRCESKGLAARLLRDHMPNRD